MAIRHRVKKRTGFTLVEMLIALAVLLLFCIMAWEILARWMSSSVVGIWRNTTDKELTIATASFRKDILKASYPSSIVPEANKVGQRSDFFVTACSTSSWSGTDWDGEDWASMRVAAFGPGPSGTLDKSEEEVLVVYHGTPGKARIPGFPDVNIEVRKITYFLRGGANVYGKGRYAQSIKNLWRREQTNTTISAEAFNPDSTSFTFSGGKERQLIQGVNQILIGVSSDALTSASESDPTSRPAVRLKILCVEPAEGKAKRSVTVTANGQTGVKFGT